MTRYYYTCDQDKRLIRKSFNNIALLLFGKNDKKGRDDFFTYFKKRVSQVNVYPQGTITEFLNNTTPGICRMDEDGNIIIEMLGYNGASPERLSWIKHEGTHEFGHSFADLLPEIKAKNPEGIIKNGILCKNHMGMIKEVDPKTGKFVGQRFYGKMFNETMMDIITSMSINSFDVEQPTSSVDDILRLNFKHWGNEKTGYSIFTSITRLAIAAFSNNGFVNYQSIVNQGYSIFNGKTKMTNKETFMINDFLYGIMFDQLHVEEEFDKFMGAGSYRIFCEFVDRLYIKSLGNQELPSEEVKRVMNVLPDFLNRKISYYLKNGILSSQGANRIVGNFNQIWNSMQQEYGAYFSNQDINDIARRASRI